MSLSIPAPTDLSGQRIDRVHARHPPRAILLAMDSMASRKVPPGMDTSPAPAAIRCLCSNRFGDRGPFGFDPDSWEQAIKDELSAVG